MAAHLGRGGPAAAGPGSGARAREIAAPAEEAGARAGSAPGGGRGRRREEEGGPGRPGFEGRTLSGVPRRVVPRCAPPGPRASSRARARRRGWCGPPPGQPRGPSCAGPRGARSYRVSRKPRRASAFSRRARSTETARWFSADHDEASSHRHTGRDEDENGALQTRASVTVTTIVTKSHTVYTETTRPKLAAAFRRRLASRPSPRASPPPRAFSPCRVFILETDPTAARRARTVKHHFTSRFCSAAACSASSPSSSRTRP